jgi:hypothetical protein
MYDWNISYMNVITPVLSLYDFVFVDCWRLCSVVECKFAQRTLLSGRQPFCNVSFVWFRCPVPNPVTK